MRSLKWPLLALWITGGCAPAPVIGFPFGDASSTADTSSTEDASVAEDVASKPDAAAPEDVVTPEDVPSPEDVVTPVDVPAPEDVVTPVDVPTPEDVPPPEDVAPAGCRSDRDCSSRNQVCNVGLMLCVDCVTARDCGDGQFCTADGVCRAQVCSPGVVACVNGTTLGECNADGSARADTTCEGGANATAACASGACALRCAMGYADCDRDPATGCEASLRDSSANCGACGRACGGTQVCTGGNCVQGPCPSGQQRCDGVCTDTSGDSANCGACGTRCTTDQTCSSGSCVARPCPTGQQRCDGACVNLSTDTRNCGACGRVCTLPVCLLGNCVSGTTCGAGLTACGTACVNLQNDPRNCGACGRACSTGQSCQSGACSSATPLRFALTWSPTADIDLWVRTPSGQVLNYQNPRVGGGVHGGDSRSTGPEEATWAATPPSGTYILCAIPYEVTRSTEVRYQIQRYGAVVSTGARTYTRSASQSGRQCTAGGTYEVARITW